MTEDHDQEKTKENRKLNAKELRIKQDTNIKLGKTDEVRKKNIRNQKSTQYKSQQISTSANLTAIGKTANPQITTPKSSAEKTEPPRPRTTLTPLRTRPKNPNDLD